MSRLIRDYPKSLLAILHDLVAASAAWWLAFWLRLNFDISAEHAATLWGTIPFVVVLQSGIFLLMGLYRGIWRYASLHDLRLLIIAIATCSLGVPTVLVLLRLAAPVPRSVFVLDPLLLLLVMGGSRFAYRAWKEQRVSKLSSIQRTPVVVLGAGDAGVSLLRDLERSGAWRAVGILDDDTRKRGAQIHGVPVLGPLQDIKGIAEHTGAETAIVAMPSATHRDRRRAVELARAAGLKVLTVPSFDDLTSGKVSVSQVRSVELDDLLGRDPIELDSEGLVDLLNGKTVLVTGAGGSIGSELCRQIARFGPARLILFELSELALYQIEQEFQKSYQLIPIVCAVGDAKDRSRVAHVFAKYRPQVVFHAAAYKHVPLMEEENAWEAVRNNVFGTYVLASAAQTHDVEKFVLISTDKAVNPVNVMGASKRMAEMVCQALQKPDGTRFLMVRFGNVLGSAGSVIPKFRSQIAAGGPVTVTHPQITRYFMSIAEAAQLVLQAGAMGGHGEIFVLDMGDPVQIVDLAKDMIRLSGLAEDEVKIVFTGLRPGEKLYEEVLADDEQTLPTPHPKLRIARARTVDGGWLEQLLDWLSAGSSREDHDVRVSLQNWLPEYCPAGSPQTKRKLTSG